MPLIIPILPDVRRSRILRGVIGLSGLAIVLTLIGCSEESYREWRSRDVGGDQPGKVIILPFILIEEAILYSRKVDKEKAAEAVKVEEVSRVARFEELKQLSGKGDAAAQHDLGFCFFYGRGAVRDLVQAAFWYRRSAEQGFAEAQNKLGLCYYNESGVSRDKAEACAWWNLAAPTNAEAHASVVGIEADLAKNMTVTDYAAFSQRVERRTVELRRQIEANTTAHETKPATR